MFKIGEFSRLGQVSTRMLRHYDQLGLLVPEQVDNWTGYRYYTIHQLARLHRIIALKELGLSLQQIGDLLGSDGELSAEQMRGMLILRQRELERELAESRQRLASVEARLAQIEQTGRPGLYEFVVKSVEAQPIASLSACVPHVGEMGYYCETLYARLYRELAAVGVRPGGLEITLYHAEEYRETDLEVEIGISMDEAGRPPVAGDVLTFRELPPHDLVASTIYEGEFSAMTPAILALLNWIGQHGHVPAGPLRELHRSGPAHLVSATDGMAVVELQLPVVIAGR